LASLVGVEGVPQFGAQFFNVLFYRHVLGSCFFVKGGARTSLQLEGVRDRDSGRKAADGGANFLSGTTGRTEKSGRPSVLETFQLQ
jgi:hypothetical protein